MTREWIYKQPDPLKVNSLSETLGISTVAAGLMVNREIDTIRDAELFLHSDLSRLHNPFLLPNMEKAVMRVRKAVDEQEKILIYGDRDVDGVTSIAILMRTLKSLGADVVWTIPGEEGYGLHASILDRFKAEGAKVVITVDCGTSAVEGVDYANSIGFDVIVTDHHLPPEILPKAYAIVNPNLRESVYPMKELAGCLTAFKFAYALMFTFNRNFNEEFVVLDLETTGLEAETDQIIEIGAVCIRNFVPVGHFHSMVKPTITIPAEASKVNKITDEMLANEEPLAVILPKFMEFIGQRTVVAHNAKFDLKFLQHASQQILQKSFNNPFVDTLAMSRENVPAKSHSLTSLAKDLNIDLPNAHRAMDDCLATAHLFQRVEEILDPRLKAFLEDQLDLVTLGTIADIVPLIGENRIIVKQGLSHLLKTRKVGLKALIRESGVITRTRSSGNDSPEQEVPTAKDISWRLTPLLNAAGRFSKAELAVQLLLTEKESEADRLAREISELNQNRRTLQKTNIDKFFQLVDQQCDVAKDSLLFVVAHGVEHGVTGIVASQMVREFQKPVVLLIAENGEAMGSSRSVPGFNIVDALEKCKDLLVKYGGHPAAAGLTVESAKIEALRTRLKEIAGTQIEKESLSAKIEIDQELEFEQVTPELVKEIARLEPFGEGNPTPLFSIKKMQIADCTLVGQQKNHLRLRLTHNSGTLNAMGWSMGELLFSLAKGDEVEAAFRLELEKWNSQTRPRLVLVDLRKTGGTHGKKHSS